MSIAIATAAGETVKRSWAEIVKGKCSSKDENLQHRIRPGARGSRLSLCRGEVLTMLSHYGWLMLFGNVDHPSADKHEGHIYVHKNDIVNDMALAPGDVVSFYLYVDDKGLGAEECSLETRPSDRWHPRRVMDMSLRLAHVFAWDDDDDDELLGTMAHDKHSEAVEDSCSESDVSSLGSAEPGCDADKGGHVICMPWKARRSPSPDGSTSAGTMSDSEGESSCDSYPVYAKTKRALPSAMSTSSCFPIGFIVPPGFRPPPGLSLPIEC